MSVSYLVEKSLISPESTAQQRDARSPIFVVVSHSDAGGTQELWLDLADGLASRGHTVVPVALYPAGSPSERFGLWRHVVARRPRNPVAALAMLWSLVRLLKTEKPRLILTAMPAANVLVPLAALLANCKFVVVTSHHTPLSTYNPILRLLDKLVGSTRAIDRSICVSDAVSASFENASARYRKKIHTVKNALPPWLEEHIDALKYQTQVRHQNARICIAVGRLSAQKNYSMLIEATAQLQGVEVKIVGDGPDRDALKALAQRAGAQSVRFVGHLPRREAARLVSEAGVFVQTSLFEGHSLALVEAAKLGIPLVVSDIPVQVEGITAADGTLCGIPVRLGDSVQLARVIQRLLDDPEFHREYSIKANKLGHEIRFDDMVGKYERLCLSLGSRDSRDFGGW